MTNTEILMIIATALSPMIEMRHEVESCVYSRRLWLREPTRCPLHTWKL